jgi:hypothetical protein
MTPPIDRVVRASIVAGTAVLLLVATALAPSPASPRTVSHFNAAEAGDEPSEGSLAADDGNRLQDIARSTFPYAYGGIDLIDKASHIDVYLTELNPDIEDYGVWSPPYPRNCFGDVFYTDLAYELAQWGLTLN